MKRLMFAMAIAATVCMAQATTPTPIGTRSGFDDLTEGDKFDRSVVGYTDWSAPNTEGEVEDTEIKAYETVGANGANYLKLDGVQNLAKKIDNDDTDEIDGTEIGEGLYIDTMVQFTASEDAPKLSEDGEDKLAIWLKETPSETEGDPSTYTLMVTAGFFDSDDMCDISEVKSYPTDAVVVPDQWYNLKVKAIANVDSEGYAEEGIAGFVVFINGNVVKTTEPTASAIDSYGDNKYIDATAETYAIFPSCIKSGKVGSTTISQLAFSGSGAIDTVAAFQGDCDPDEEGDTYAVTVRPDQNATYAAAYKVGGEAITPDNDVLTVTVGQTIVITATPAANYEYAETPTGWTAGQDGEITIEVSAAAEITIPAPTAKSVEPTDWPTGDDLDKVAGTTAAATFGISGALANVDAKVFATWASGNGGIAYADKGTVTINEKCFLLNIANSSDEAAIAAAEATAKEAIKITAISFDENGDVVLTYPATYGNGKIVVEGSAQLPAEWHDKVDADKFFRTKLVLDEVAAPAVGD